MPFQESNGLRFYKFDIFSENITHAVFTRHGGVSPSPWGSLNFSISVGDDRQNVATNRARAFESVGCDPASYHDVHLVHGVDVFFADRPRDPNKLAEKTDILFTDNPDVSLFMCYADCVPLIFHDPKQKVIGLAHAGWMGTVKGVAEVSVKAMIEKYNSKPEDIVVGIGPSISVEKYEVGEDVASQFRNKFGKDAEKVIVQKNNKTHLDLWEANAILLKKCGVQNIQISGLCTASNTEDWFSHRAEKGKTGRFGALLAMNKS